MKCFFNEDWSVLEKKLIVSTALLLGIIIGFVFAPIKKEFIAATIMEIPSFLNCTNNLPAN